jgi:two-component system chemotaxis response regulator CheB
MLLLSELREDFPVPIVISQHLHCNSPLILDSVLNRHSRLTVKWAENGERLIGGVVYLVVPNSLTTIGTRGRLRVRRFQRPNKPCRSGDTLFRSAARIFGKSTLAVILTGCLYDGTAGAVDVKRRGGRVLAQDEATSDCFDMPRSAIDADAVDCVLPIGTMASAISSLVGQQHLARSWQMHCNRCLQEQSVRTPETETKPDSKLESRIGQRVESFLSRCSRLRTESEGMLLYNRFLMNGEARRVKTPNRQVEVDLSR